jgi:hypothetical protein
MKSLISLYIFITYVGSLHWYVVLECCFDQCNVVTVPRRLNAALSSIGFSFSFAITCWWDGGGGLLFFSNDPASQFCFLVSHI